MQDSGFSQWKRVLLSWVARDWIAIAWNVFMKMGKCAFQQVWLTSPTYRDWLRPVPGDRFAARCTKCQKNFSVCNMGESALKSHIKSDKHVKNCKEVDRNFTINFGGSKAKSDTAPVVSEAAKLGSDVQTAEIIWAAKCVNRWIIEPMTTNPHYLSWTPEHLLDKKLFLFILNKIHSQSWHLME